MKGIIAQKIGMTNFICPETGKVTAVTLCAVPENKILQIKTVEKDGYSAAVLAAFERKKNFKNVGKKFKMIREIFIDENDNFKKDEKISLKILENLEKIKITGISKGRGFAGVIKKYNFSRGPETHGSHHHREPGSVGMCAKPARILKGKKMPGRHGGKKTTIISKIVKFDFVNNLIALKGAVPGAKKSFIFLREK